MKLGFAMPAFYKKRYNTEKEIDEFCESICNMAKEKEYSDKINRIDFIPVILPDDLIQQGLGEEFTKIELKYKLVAMSRQINFDTYQSADLQGKKKLLVKCLVESLREVKKKIAFDIDAFERDINSLLSSQS